MPAHSKRNTSLAFFTAYERSLLKTAWGSQRTHLSRDSALPFSSCSLCLLHSRDPVSCPEGDIFCRECAIKNLVAQREEIGRLEKEWGRRRRDDEEREGWEDERVRKRQLEDFEMLQAGITGRYAKGENGEVVDGAERAVKKGTKRKFSLDEEEVTRLANEERQKIKRSLDEEKRAERKHTAFWAPSEIPDDIRLSQIPEKPPKLDPLCPMSEEQRPHKLTLKSLTSIRFTEEEVKGNQTMMRSCPACRKALTNVSRGVLAVPCGHVLCKACVDKFMRPESSVNPHDPEAARDILRCYVCDERLTADGPATGRATEDEIHSPGDGTTKKKKRRKDKDAVKRGLVELKSDGTGFAGRGKNVVEKSGVAFQC